MRNKLLAIFVMTLFLASFAAALDSQGLEKTINEENTLLFTVNGKTTNIRVDNINYDREGNYFAILSIGSRFIESRLPVRFYVDDVNQFDTDLDNIDDLEVKLLSLKGSSSATVFLREIKAQQPVISQPVEEKVMVKEEAQPATVQEAQPAEPLQPVTGQAVRETGNRNSALGWTILGVVVLLGLIVYFATKKKT